MDRLNTVSEIIHARPCVNWTMCDVCFVDIVELNLFNDVARLKMTSVCVMILKKLAMLLYVSGFQEPAWR